jgi:hypothetical protein
MRTAKAGFPPQAVHSAVLGSAWRKYVDVCITDLDEACFHVRGCRDCPRARGQKSRYFNRHRGRKEFAGHLGYPAMHEAHSSLYTFHTRRFPGSFTRW